MMQMSKQRRSTVHQSCYNQIKGVSPVKCGITGQLHQGYSELSSPSLSAAGSRRGQFNNIESGYEKKQKEVSQEID